MMMISDDIFLEVRSSANGIYEGLFTREAARSGSVNYTGVPDETFLEVCLI